MSFQPSVDLLDSPHRARLHCGSKFVRLLRHHVLAPNPAYRRLIRRSGVTVPVNPEIDLLPSLPLTDKAFLRDSGYATQPAAEVFRVVATSGSTQSAVRVPHNYEMSRATLGDNFLRLFRLNDIALRGTVYGVGHWEPGEENTGSYLTFHFMSQVLPDFVMASTRDALEEHADRIQRLSPGVLASSPAFLGRLARYCLETKREHSIGTIIFGGAPLLQDDEAAIRQAFKPELIRGFYATTDAGALAAEIGGGVYWTFSETHIIEVLDGNGHHVAPGERGRIAVTALDSLAAPIIRYLVGDEVTFCGRSEDGVRVALRDIKRVGEAIVADAKIPLADIDRWRDRFYEHGLRVSAVQLVRRRVQDGREHLLMKVELRGGNRRDAADLALALLMENPQVRYLVTNGEIPLPEIVIAEPGELLGRGFKVPVFVDEVAASR